MRTLLMVIVTLVSLLAGGCGIAMDRVRAGLLDQALASANAQAAAAKAGTLDEPAALAALSANAGAMKALDSAPWYQVMANPTYRQYLHQAAAIMAAASSMAAGGKVTLPMECAYLQAEAEMFVQIKDVCNGVATTPTPITVTTSAAIHGSTGPPKAK